MCTYVFGTPVSNYVRLAVLHVGTCWYRWLPLKHTLGRQTFEVTGRIPHELFPQCFTLFVFATLHKPKRRFLRAEWRNATQKATSNGLMLTVPHAERIRDPCRHRQW